MNNDEDESEWISEEEEELLSEEEEESLEEEVEVLSYEEEGIYIMKMFTSYFTSGTNYCHATMYYIESYSPYNLQITPS